MELISLISQLLRNNRHENIAMFGREYTPSKNADGGAIDLGCGLLLGGMG